MAQREIQLSDNLLKTMNMNADEFVTSMSTEYAKILFKEGKLGLMPAADLCGVDFRDFMSILALADIPIIDYDPEDWAREVAMIKSMGKINK